MRIYFTAPLYQKENFIDIYNKIIFEIVKKGHSVVEDILDSDCEHVLRQDQKEVDKYYRKWHDRLKNIDLCIAEISFPCTVNIGFEIASILNYGKPVIALFRCGKDPKFISPEFSRKMIKIPYELETLPEAIDDGLAEAELMLNTRFTLNLFGNQDLYLEKVTKKRNISKSDYIRNLIDEDMKKK